MSQQQVSRVRRPQASDVGRAGHGAAAEPAAAAAWGARRRTGATVLGVAAAAAAVWAVAVPVAGVDLVVGEGAQARTVGLASVVVVSLLVALAAVGSRRLLVRRRRGALTWNVLAAAVLVVSLAGPASAADASAWAVLTLLHLVVGGLLVGTQRWTAAGRPLERDGVA